MAYLNELRANARAVSAATIGMGAGLSINIYVNSLLAPYLIRDLGWSRAEFALLGATGLLVFVAIPLAGRLTDLYGVRRVAASGVVAYPLFALAYSLMPGPIWVFFVLATAQILFCVTTTATVYCRLIAERIVEARGLALAIAASGPALVGAIGSPLLAGVAEAHGWRVAYQALALFSAVAGGLAILLAPSSRGLAAGRVRPPSARRDYGAVFRSRVFWTLLAGTFLCSLPQALAHSQLAVMLDEHRLTVEQAKFTISIFAGGTLVGRFLLGFALDRFATWAVAMAGLSLSGFGLLAMTLPGATYPVLAAGVALMGMAFGAEADILGYATARYFDIRLYSSVLGLLIASAGFAGAIGAMVLSATIAATGSFRPFMLGCGLVVLAGSLVFVRLRGVGQATAQAAAP